VDLDVAGDVARPRQEAGVVPAGRFELGGHGRDVGEFPDLDPGADGQPVTGQGHAHRRREAAEVGVEVIPLIANQHEPARLVSRDQERRAELPQQRREVAGVDGAQGLGVYCGGRPIGRGRVEVNFGEGGFGDHG
jgi:hypothetical protein